MSGKARGPDHHVQRNCCAKELSIELKRCIVTESRLLLLLLIFLVPQVQRLTGKPGTTCSLYGSALQVSMFFPATHLKRREIIDARQVCRKTLSFTHKLPFLFTDDTECNF